MKVILITDINNTIESITMNDDRITIIKFITMNIIISITEIRYRKNRIFRKKKNLTLSF